MPVMQQDDPTTSLLAPNTAIWVHDEKESWTQARLVEVAKASKGFKITFHTEDDPKTTHTALVAELPPLRNTTLNESRLDNLTDLTHLNEPSVLTTIRERYLDDDIYTYSGIVLVSVNPYRKLDLYSNELIWTFNGRVRDELEPHLFAVAEEAYRSLLGDGGSQSIIVSGESGAGKTISAKFIMRYLAEVCKQGSDIGGIEAKILATNPILEAFGNAKTVRNDNSSRFGKYVQILFNSRDQIIGAQIRTFLLETTRVVGHAAGERNYHVFYQMLAGLPEADLKQLGLTSDASQYAYLGAERIDDVDDKEEFELTCKSLSLAGFSMETQLSLWTVLAAVLHIGNIKISEGSDAAQISADDNSLVEAARLLQVDPALFSKWLTSRLLKAGTEVVETTLSVQQAVASRDSVARHLYGLVFDHIIGALNRALRPQQLLQPMRFIGVLDIYGFERFDRNSFEQFCINYANEKLQFQFNQQVFKLEQALYESEGIRWSFINFNDNQPCIEMIEGRQGILRMLAEECRVPNGSDRQLAEKINMRFDESLLCRSKFDRDSHFTVKHFAYDVPYEVDGFLEKNRDSFPPEQLELLRGSRDPFVASLFEEITEPTAASRSGSQDAMGRGEAGRNTGLAFKQSLSELMDTMGATRMHYIRCIKPNQSKEPLAFDAPFVVQQLRACGIIETIRISAAGFPGRWSFADFCSRYRVLAPEQRPDGSAEAAGRILAAVGLGEDDYQVGRTRIFLRAGVLGKLEDRRTAQITAAAVCIQANIRACFQRAAFKRTLTAVEALQQGARRCMARAQYMAMRREQAATAIASSFLRWACIAQTMASKKAAEKITASWKRFAARQVWAEHRQGASATAIASAFRAWQQRRCQQARRQSAAGIALACKRHLARQELRRLRAESRSVARLVESSGALERRVMDLAARLQAVELERDGLREQEMESKGHMTALEEKVAGRDAEVAYLEDQIAMLQEQLESLESEKNKRILALEGRLEEAQDRLLHLEDQLKYNRPTESSQASAMAMLRKQDSGRLEEPVGSRRHLRRLSMDSKLEHLAGLTLPQIPVRRHEPTVPRKDLLLMLKDPRVVDELHVMVASSAGFDARKMGDDTADKGLLLRLPVVLLEHWIACWLDLDPEPLGLGDHFYALMAAVKGVCSRAINTTEGPLTADQQYAYWLANLVQLLGLLQHRITAMSAGPGQAVVVSREQQMSPGLVVLLQMRTVAARAVEDLYRQWLGELCRWFARLGPAALMDHQGLAGYSSTGMTTSVPERPPGSRFLSSLLGRRASSPQLSTEIFLAGLDELAGAMAAAGLQAEIVEQLLGSLFAHICAIAFNELLVRKAYATWRRGIQIQYNLSQLEDWASRLRHAHPAWIPYGPPLPQTEPLLQAVKLLQLAKSATTEDIPVIQDACPALTTSQLRRILSLYTPDEFEDGPVCPALMRALALKCQQEELSGQSAELTIPEVHPDAEPLKLSIKPIAPALHLGLPAAVVPPSLWKLFTLAGSSL